MSHLTNQGCECQDIAMLNMHIMGGFSHDFVTIFQSLKRKVSSAFFGVSKFFNGIHLSQSGS